MTPNDEAADGDRTPYADHEEHELIGAWLLGGLDPDEAGRLEAHLDTCNRCREEADSLRELVPLLREVDPDAIRPVGVTPPAALDERIHRTLAGPSPTGASYARPRGRLWAVGVGGLVVGAAAASLLVATTTDDSSAPPGVAAPVVTVDDVRSADGVRATAGYVDHTWGVEIKLKARGLAPGKSFAVEVVDEQGVTHDAGAFIGVAADRTVDCDVNASVLSAQADRFVVVGPGGRTMIEGDLRS